MADASPLSSLNAPLVAAIATVVAALIAGLFALAGGFAGAWFAYVSKHQELRVRLIEIAISILRADPKENVAPARGWAIEVIEKNSGVKFSDEGRQALLSKPLAAKESWEEAEWMVREAARMLLRPPFPRAPRAPSRA